MKIKTPNFNTIAVNAKRAKIWMWISLVMAAHVLIGFKMKLDYWDRVFKSTIPEHYEPQNRYERWFQKQEKAGFPVFMLEFIALCVFVSLSIEFSSSSKEFIKRTVEKFMPGARIDIKHAKLMAEYVSGLMTDGEKLAIKKAIRAENFEEIKKIVDVTLERERARNSKIDEDLKAIAKGQMYVFSGLGHGSR